MKIKSNKSYSIGPDWSAVALMTFFVAFCAYALYAGYEPSYPPVNMRDMLIITLIALLYVFRSYECTSKNLVIKVLFVTIRKLPWEQFGQVLVLHAWKAGSKGQKKDFILFTKKNCTPYQVHTDKIYAYTMSHPFKTVLIEIPAKKKHECIRKIREYCEVVEYSG